MTTIIDFHTHVGQSIFGYGQTAEELLESMDLLGIAHSVVCPVQPRDYHLPPANDDVAAAVERRRDRLTGFCRVDPRRGQEALRELERAVDGLSLRGLFLNPWEDGYRINAPFVFPVVELCGRLGVPIMVAAGYPWRSHPLQVADLARRFPGQLFVMTHGGQLNISGLAQQDAMAALHECVNLLIEVSGVYRQDFIEDVVARLGPTRVLFGSNSPCMHQEFELERIRSMKITDAQRELILGANAQQLLAR